MPEPTTTENETESTPTFISTNRIRELIQGNPDIKTDQDKADFLQALESRGHEIEGLNAKFDFGDAAKNFIPDVVETGKALAHMLTSNPLQTIEGISSVARGALRKVLPDPVFNPGAKLRQALPNALGGTDLTPEQQKEQDNAALGTMADLVVENFGSVDRALNTLEKHPAQFLSTVATLGEGAALKGAQVGAKAGLLSNRAANILTKTAEVMNRTAKLGDPVAIVMGTAKLPFKAIKAANDAIGLNKLIRTADVNDKMIAGLTMTSGERLKMATKLKSGQYGEELAKMGVTGTLPEMSEQLAEIGSKSKLILDKSLERITKTFKTSTAEKILDNLADLKKSASYAKLPKKTQAEFDRIVDLAKANKTKGLTLSELNEIKRGMYEIVTDKAFRNPATPTISQAQKNAGRLYDEVKTFIEDTAAKNGVGNVRKLNQQTQFAKEMKGLIDTKIARGGDQAAKAATIGKQATQIFFQEFLYRSKLGKIYGAFKGAKGLFQTMRGPQFQRDLATAIQLLKDGEFKTLEGGFKLNRPATKLETKLLGKQARRQANENALKVLDGVIQNLSKAYPTLRGLRLISQAG